MRQSRKAQQDAAEQMRNQSEQRAIQAELEANIADLNALVELSKMNAPGRGNAKEQIVSSLLWMSSNQSGII